MNLCKNVECTNEVKTNRVYCSLRCRNVYVNTHLRDYSKNGEGLSKESEYSLNPKKCKLCNDTIPYKKRFNNFCGSSCAATNTNRNRPKEFYKNHGKLLKERGSGISDKRIIYDKNPKKCINCDYVFPFNKRKRLFCSRKCKSLHNRNGSLQNYRLLCKFKFNLSNYPDEFDFKLIEEHGWYSAKNRGNNLYGVSRDHMYSIRSGFDNNINPEIISHPANCRLLLHSDNVSKGFKSSITLDELKLRIKNWDTKYGLIV